MIRPVPHHRLARAAAVAALLMLSGGCAGYQIGNQSLYPLHIRTVYVPMFDSVSYRRNLGERLTEAVQKEIELKTPYKVVNDPGADSVLLGCIVGESKQLVVAAHSGEPRESQVNFQVEINWIDSRGEALRQVASIPLPPEMTNVGSQRQRRARGRPVHGHRPAAGHQPPGRRDRGVDGSALVGGDSSDFCRVRQSPEKLGCVRDAPPLCQGIRPANVPCVKKHDTTTRSDGVDARRDCLIR